MVVVVVVVVRLVLVNHALNLAELLHVARDGNGAFLIKPIFFLSLLQQLHEEWMVDVYNRDNNPLLLLPLTHHNSQATLRNISHHHHILLMMVEVKVGKVQVKIIQKIVGLVMIPTHLMIRKREHKLNYQKPLAVLMNLVCVSDRRLERHQRERPGVGAGDG